MCGLLKFTECSTDQITSAYYKFNGLKSYIVLKIKILISDKNAL